jgi:hypothetical protein
MNLQNVRNIVIVIGAVVVGVAALGFLTTLISSVVPIAITGVVAFALGWMARGGDLNRFFSRGSAAAAKVETLVTSVSTARAEAKPTPAKTTAPDAAKTAERPADEPPAAKDALLDPNFEIKTPEQIEAEARRREQEIAKKATSATPQDVAAALEERRKRLLGDKGDEQGSSQPSAEDAAQKRLSND